MFLFLWLPCQAKATEYDDPEQVHPTPERNHDGKDNAKDVPHGGLGQDRSDADIDLRNPVDDGDKEQEDLNQSRLFIKPLHL